MPNIESVMQGQWLGFILWTLVIWGVAFAIFRSFPAKHLHDKLWFKSPEQHQKLKILQYEARTGQKYDPRVLNKDPLVIPQKLSLEETTQRRNELLQYSKTKMFARILSYLMECQVCQHGWATILMYCLYGNWSYLVPTVAVYATAATLFNRLISIQMPKGTCTSGNCSKH